MFYYFITWHFAFILKRNDEKDILFYLYFATNRTSADLLYFVTEESESVGGRNKGERVKGFPRRWKRWAKSKEIRKKAKTKRMADLLFLGVVFVFFVDWTANIYLLYVLPLEGIKTENEIKPVKTLILWNKKPFFLSVSVSIRFFRCSLSFLFYSRPISFIIITFLSYFSSLWFKTWNPCNKTSVPVMYEAHAREWRRRKREFTENLFFFFFSCLAARFLF